MLGQRFISISAGLVVAAAASGDCVSFGPAVQLIPEAGATTVRAADIDGDGDLDLVTANRTGGPAALGSVSLFRNLGGGDLAEPENTPLTGGDEYPRSMAVADFDDDGDADLVTANWLSDTVTLLTNDGTGQFSLVSIATGPSPTAVAAGDVDGNELPDIIIAAGSMTTGAVFVHRNLGGGVFEMAGPYEVLLEPRAITPADFDGDLDVDLIVACRASDALALLMNNGDGTYAAAVQIDVGVRPRSTTAADLDGDDDIDVAVAMFADPDRTDGTCWVLENDGAGNFSVSGIYAASNGPHGVDHADLDDDGDVDLAVANVGSTTVTILMNDGTGLFPQTDFTSIGNGFNLGADVALADLDGDDLPDLLVGHPTSTEAGEGRSTYRRNTTNDGGGCIDPKGDEGDLDGNGVVDVTDLVTLIVSWGPCETPPAPCLADLNGDLVVDVIDLVTIILNWGPVEG